MLKLHQIPGTFYRHVKQLGFMLLLLAMLTTPLFGSEPLVLNDSKDERSLGSHLEYIIDQKSVLTLEELLAGKEKYVWTKSTSEVPSFGFSDATFWLRFTVINGTSTLKNLFLELAHPLHDEMIFYFIKDDGTFEKRRFGDREPFAMREIKYRNFAFPLSFEPQQKRVIYLKVKTEGSVSIPLVLWNPEKFAETQTNEIYGLGIYYGIMFVMILYNFFLFLSIHNKNYIYYVLYICSHALFQMGLNGLSFQYLFPNYPAIANMSIPASLGSTSLWLSLFTMSFLQTSKHMKFTHYALKGIFTWAVAIIVFSFITSYDFVIKQCAVLSIITAFTVLIAATQSFIKGHPAARYFLLAFAVFLVGIIVSALRTLGVVPVNFFTLYSAHIGSTMEVILLSLALADKLNELQKERDMANRALIEGFRKLEVEVGRRHELEQQNNILGNEIRTATEKLVQADKMSMLGQLIAGIAHDIASPSQLITTAQGENLEAIVRSEERVKALIGEASDPEAKEILESFAKDYELARKSNELIKTAVIRIRDIQTAVLSQSRIDREIKEVTLQSLIEECKVILRSKMRRFNVQVDCPAHISIRCRRTQIGQLITNLLSNAADELAGNESYTPEKDSPDIILRVCLHPNLKDKSMVSIDCEDNGRGIPQDKIDRIFEAFYTTKELGAGTGLGLSICKKIVESHAGLITVQKAQLLKGACFHVELPVHAEHAAAPSVAKEENAA
jgi:signal transduction histidine kinase